MRQFLFLQGQPGEAGLEVDGDRRAILLRLLHVVDVDVVAEDGPGVAVFRRHGGAGKGDEGRVRQRIAQMLRIAHLEAGAVVGARIGSDQGVGVVRRASSRAQRRFDRLQPGFEAVLGAVGFVGDDDDVVPVRQQRKCVFVLAWHELLDGGEDDAAGRAIGQSGAQILPRIRLYGLFAQEILRQREHAEELAVEVVAVGDDDDGRILHRRVLHHAGGKAGHGDALAAALGMPDHAALVSAAGARCGNDAVDGGAHGMELVVAGDLLDQRAVVLEQHEKAQVVEQGGGREKPAHHGFQLVELAQRVERDAVDRAPALETLGVGGKRAAARLAAVRNHEQLVVLEQIGNLVLVGLDLLVGFPDVRIFVGRILEFDQHQRQAIDEQDHVGPARVVGALDRELVDRKPIVRSRRRPVDQAHEVTERLAVLLVRDRNAACEQLVEQAIGGEQGGVSEIHHLADRIFARRGRNRRIESAHGSAQALEEQHLAVIGALRRVAVGRDVRPVERRITHLLQPAEGFLFELVFGHRQFSQRASRSMYGW